MGIIYSRIRFRFLVERAVNIIRDGQKQALTTHPSPSARGKSGYISIIYTHINKLEHK
jgi:hypothetical protein